MAIDFTKIRRIVTHGGRAHLDDLMSVAIALYLVNVRYPLPDETRFVKVRRRDPSEEELADPSTLVLDVGGRYEPELGNFDHHQLPRDAEPSCAALLLLESVMGAECFAEVYKAFPWIKNMAVLDSKGPVALAKEIGCSVDSVFGMQSPIQNALLDLFEQKTVLGPEVLAYSLADIGKQVLLELCEFLKHLEVGRACVQVVDAGGVSGIYVPKILPPSVTRVLRDEKGDIAFLIAPDDRGTGFTLYRYDDDARLDFSLVEGDENVTFAHKGGFIAKTVSKDMDVAMSLVQRALTVVST